jgi:hypothetical protein
MPLGQKKVGLGWDLKSQTCLLRLHNQGERRGLPMRHDLPSTFTSRIRLRMMGRSKKCTTKAASQQTHVLTLSRPTQPQIGSFARSKLSWLPLRTLRSSRLHLRLMVVVVVVRGGGFGSLSEGNLKFGCEPRRSFASRVVHLDTNPDNAFRRTPTLHFILLGTRSRLIKFCRACSSRKGVRLRCRASMTRTKITLVGADEQTSRS